MTAWTNKSVESFADGADPVEKIQENARDWVLKAIEAGWEGPPYNPIEIAKLMGITVEPSYDIADARTIDARTTALSLNLILRSRANVFASPSPMK